MVHGAAPLGVETSARTHHESLSAPCSSFSCGKRTPDPSLAFPEEVIQRLKLLWWPICSRRSGKVSDTALWNSFFLSALGQTGCELKVSGRTRASDEEERVSASLYPRETQERATSGSEFGSWLVVCRCHSSRFEQNVR